MAHSLDSVQAVLKVYCHHSLSLISAQIFVTRLSENLPPVLAYILEKKSLMLLQRKIRAKSLHAKTDALESLFDNLKIQCKILLKSHLKA